MTIQEVGNHIKWIEILKERIANQVDTVIDTNDDEFLMASFGQTDIEVCAFSRLAVYIDIQYNKNLVAVIHYNGKVEDRFVDLIHSIDVPFNLDTEGISILIDVLKTMKDDTVKSLVESIKETERLYKQKFYGKLSGNRFGF